MAEFNLFQWIRNGVRQSVLQGVADAVETIGTPEDNALKKEIVAALESKPASTRAASKKRLGRSLKEINTA